MKNVKSPVDGCKLHKYGLRAAQPTRLSSSLLWMEWKLVDHRSSEKTFNGHLRKNARLLPLRQTANDFYGRCMTSRSSRSIVRLEMQKTYAALITQTPSESQVAACWETRQILLKNARNGSCGSDEWHSMLVIRFITICASLDGSKSARETPGQ